MDWLDGLLWGAFGGFAMEALDYIVAVRRWRRLPWNLGASSLTPGHLTSSARRDEPTGELPAPGVVAYTIAGVLRVTVGGGVAEAVTVTTPHHMSAWLAVLVGAAAPVVLEKVTVFVPLVVSIGKEGIAGGAFHELPPSAAQQRLPFEMPVSLPEAGQNGQQLPITLGGADTSPAGQGGTNAG
ncbi:hypothetical protein ACIRU8_42770 [Streptomyces sp. NPDC101175]|uniref:hypothetical protein n=1 Tax=Streptomyces sp. NPDC101175 TaxID=3366123 RepID=UPI003832C99F